MKLQAALLRGPTCRFVNFLKNIQTLEKLPCLLSEREVYSYFNNTNNLINYIYYDL